MTFSKLRKQNIHQRSQQRKPVVIEFSGMPRAGKDTAIHALAGRLRRAGIHVEVSREGARLCPFDKSDHLSYTRWGVHRILNRLLELQHARRRIFTIFNRGPFDAEAFLELLVREHDLVPREKRLIVDYLHLRTVPRLVEHVVVLMVSPGMALQRDRLARRRPRTGRIMNLRTLRRLHTCYSLLIQEPKWSKRLTVIDTTSLTPRQVSARVWSALVGPLGTRVGRSPS